MSRYLEIGSGWLPTVGMEHLDIDPDAPLLNHHCDASGPLPFDDGTFDAIKAYDVLEHISWQRTGEVLTEWARILAPGGTLDLMVPDAESIMRRHVTYAAAGDAGRALADGDGWIPEHLRGMPLIAAAVWRLFGGHVDGERVTSAEHWVRNAHAQGFSEDSLRWYLERAGLRVDSIVKNPHPNLIVRATKL